MTILRLLGLALLGCVAAWGCGDQFVTADADATSDDAASGGQTAASGGASGEGGEPGATGGDTSILSKIPREGLILWLRADRGVEEVGGVVARWADQSAAKNDAVQSASASRPTLATNGGKAALSFDGVDDSLTLPDAFGSWESGLSVYVAFQMGAVATCGSFLEFSNGGEVDDISVGYWDNKFLYEVGEPYVQSISAPTVGKPALLAASHAGTTATLQVNGEVDGLATFAMSAPVARSFNAIGASQYGGCSPLQGFVSEIIVYSRALTPAESLLVSKEVSDRWL